MSLAPRCAVSVVLLLAACGADPRATPGLEGRVSFKYGSGWGYVALGGYPLTTALAPGTTESLQLLADLPMSVRAESSDEAVATFEVRPDTISDDGRDRPFLVVHAHQPGSAALRLVDARGALLDRAVVRVAAPARAVIVVDDVDETHPVVLAGRREATVQARALDAAGEEVLASTGWTWRVADARVAALWVLNGADPDLVAQELSRAVDFTTLMAVQPGETTLTLSLAGASVTTPVTVGVGP